MAVNCKTELSPVLKFAVFVLIFLTQKFSFFLESFTSLHIFLDYTALNGLFLELLPHTDDADDCNHQHYSQYRQRGGQRQSGFVLRGPFVLTAVPVVPPVVAHNTSGAWREKKKNERGKKTHQTDLFADEKNSTKADLVNRKL